MQPGTFLVCNHCRCPPATQRRYSDALQLVECTNCSTGERAQHSEHSTAQRAQLRHRPPSHVAHGAAGRVASRRAPDSHCPPPPTHAHTPTPHPLAGTYKADASNEPCTRCPQERALTAPPSGATGAAQCRCPAGQYMLAPPDRSAPLSWACVWCEGCSEHISCPRAGMFLEDLEVAAGYWRPHGRSSRSSPHRHHRHIVTTTTTTITIIIAPPSS